MNARVCCRPTCYWRPSYEDGRGCSCAACPCLGCCTLRCGWRKSANPISETSQWPWYCLPCSSLFRFKVVQALFHKDIPILLKCKLNARLDQGRCLGTSCTSQAGGGRSNNWLAARQSRWALSAVGSPAAAFNWRVASASLSRSTAATCCLAFRGIHNIGARGKAAGRSRKTRRSSSPSSRAVSSDLAWIVRDSCCYRLEGCGRTAHRRCLMLVTGANLTQQRGTSLASVNRLSVSNRISTATASMVRIWPLRLLT
jgi:hypothetical protein